MITVQFNEDEMTLKDNEEIVFQDVLEREGNQYFLQFNRGEKCIRISEAKFNGWYVIPEPYDDKVDFKFENGIYYFDYDLFNFGMNCVLSKRRAE